MRNGGSTSHAAVNRRCGRLLYSPGIRDVRVRPSPLTIITMYYLEATSATADVSLDTLNTIDSP